MNQAPQEGVKGHHVKTARLCNFAVAFLHSAGLVSRPNPLQTKHLTTWLILALALHPNLARLDMAARPTGQMTGFPDGVLGPLLDRWDSCKSL